MAHENNTWWKEEWYWDHSLTIVNFGCLPELPDDYGVVWSDRNECFVALGPDENMEVSFCNRFDAYNQCRNWAK